MFMGYFHHSKKFLHPDSTKWNYQWKKNDCRGGGGKTKQQIVTVVPGTLWTGHHRETDGSMKKGRKSWVNAEIVCPVSKVIRSCSNKRQRWPRVTWDVALQAKGACPSHPALPRGLVWVTRAGIHLTYCYVDVASGIVTGLCYSHWGQTSFYRVQFIHAKIDVK